MDEEIIKTSVILPKDLWRKAKILAAEKDTNFTQIVEEALREYLEKHEKKARLEGSIRKE